LNKHQNTENSVFPVQISCNLVKAAFQGLFISLKEVYGNFDYLSLFLAFLCCQCLYFHSFDNPYYLKQLSSGKDLSIPG
jgi:hypothetical protein